MTKHTPWGREVQEPVPGTPWGRPLEEDSPGYDTLKLALEGGRPAASPRKPTFADFREVGLSEADATAAAAGLAGGKYLSFEDACLSQTIFGGTGNKVATLDEARMRAKARSFVPVNG
jgi:hypothetical protein